VSDLIAQARERARQINDGEDNSVENGTHMADDALALAQALEDAEAKRDRLREQVNQYRIEADRALRDYDGLELDAGLMGEALSKIAEGRPNERFDPWARELARETLAKVSDRVTAMLPALAAVPPPEEKPYEPLAVDALADELLAAINDYPAERPFSRDPARGAPERRLAVAYNRLYCELHDLAAAVFPPEREEKP
jgi:hypothetical protein